MVGARTTTTTTTTDQMSYIRKVRKPMVEKKRRERMNTSISQLKSLIAQTIKHNTAPMTRVDKTDILELTVYHLRQLQQQQNAVALATEAAAYNAGYSACAREAVAYLSNAKMTSSSVKGSLSNHLHSTILQQSTVYRNGNQSQHSLGTGSQRQIRDRLSTPLRPSGSFSSPLPEMNLSGYSPIQDGTNSLPEPMSSCVYSSLNSSSSIDFSSSYSSASISLSASNQSLDNNNDDDREEQDIIKVTKNTNVITIGDGKENEIGHVIKEVPWRPFQ